AEVVEIEMAPVPGMLIDQADENLLVHVRPQVDGDAAEVLFLDAGSARQDFLGVIADQLDTRLRPRAAADEERRPRMRHLERHRGERALRLVAVQLVAADPVLALVVALHVAAALGDGVALDRLALERLTLGGPVLERAGLEVEIERLAVGADG